MNIRKIYDDHNKLWTSLLRSIIHIIITVSKYGVISNELKKC